MSKKHHKKHYKKHSKKRTKKHSKSMKKGGAKKGGAQKGGNSYFDVMNAARKSNAPSFKYNGKTYHRHTKHNGKFIFYKK